MYKMIGVMAAVFVLVCGCGDGKTENTGNTATMEEIPAVNEEGQEEIPTEDRQKREESPVEEEEQEGEKSPAAEDGQEQEDNVIWDDVTGEGIKTIYGTVRSMEENSFMIEQAITGTLKEGGGEIMVMGSSGNEEESGMTAVVYDEDTEFTVSTTADGGITSTRREGSGEDLREGSSLGITGSWEGETFRADDIVIFISQ